MAQEFKIFDPNCNCEVITRSPEQVALAATTLAKLSNPKFPPRDISRNEIVSYVRIEVVDSKVNLTLVARPHQNGTRNLVDQLTIEATGKTIHSRRQAQGWEVSEERYRSVLDFHINGSKESPGYGRNRSFDKYFTVQAKSPNWISLSIKEGFRLGRN